MVSTKKRIVIFTLSLIFIIGSLTSFAIPAWGQTIMNTMRNTLQLKEKPIRMIIYENKEFGFRFGYPDKFFNAGEYANLKHREHWHKDNRELLVEVNFINSEETNKYFPLQLFFNFDVKTEQYVDIDLYVQKEIERIRSGPYGEEEKFELIEFNNSLVAGFTTTRGRYTGVRKYIDHNDYIYEISFTYENSIFDPELSLEEYKRKYGEEMGKYYIYAKERYDVIQNIIDSFSFLYGKNS